MWVPLLRDSYVPRRLRTRLAGKDHLIGDTEIMELGLPLVILGDPGMGKTWLTEYLAETSGGIRVTAGTFVRVPSAALPSDSRLVIIDGLDEIATSNGAAAVDAVLTRLGEIGYPDFILSCRAADWSGSVDRHKIAEDYEIEPRILQLLPFTRDDAETLLKNISGNDYKIILKKLDEGDLAEFYTNPLTLHLVVEVVLDGQGLPGSRSDLLNRASRLLLSERNPAHQRSLAARASANHLLDAAGAIFAHLLLSGSSGVADLPTEETPDGYVALGDFVDLVGGTSREAALRTRLFRSSQENLFEPYHRVIAEFLGANWLSKQIGKGLSERRVHQAMTFAGGVPTALRGLHAWLGLFTPALRDECIRTDPYGFLCYGDPERLPLPQARLLLKSVSELADEDPYFRSEDWGRRIASGLARLELKSEIIALLKSPDRHLDLSTLVLEALQASELTTHIVPDLSTLIADQRAPYIERYIAAEALIAAHAKIDWPEMVRCLSMGHQEDQRLALELVGLKRADGFDSQQLASLLLDYHGGFSSDPPEETVVGVDRSLLKHLSSTQCADVLDVITQRISEQRPPSYWRLNYRMTAVANRLISTALQADTPPSAEQLWRWLRMTDAGGSRSDHVKERVSDTLRRHQNLRHQVQRFAISEKEVEGTPWTAVAYELLRAHRDLGVTIDDAVMYLNEIADCCSLSAFHKELWKSLVRLTWTSKKASPSVEVAARRGMAKHSELLSLWEEITSVRESDWAKTEQRRRRRTDRERQRKFKGMRDELLPHVEEFASATNLGALIRFANAYLDRYSDLDHDKSPIERVQEWLGDTITDSALEGFVKYAHRSDIPSAKEIAEAHAKKKEWNTEPILICCIAETLRRGLPIAGIPRPVLESALATWWSFPDNNTLKQSEDIGSILEDEVFSGEPEIFDFLTTVMEPHIAGGKEHVPNLYQLAHSDRYRQVAGGLALRWLRAYPSANPLVQFKLRNIVLRRHLIRELRALARERCDTIGNVAGELLSMWMATRFFIDFEASVEDLRRFCAKDKTFIWAVREVSRADGSADSKRLSLPQLEFIVQQFAIGWPPKSHPDAGWSGSQNPWDASDFIQSAINGIGADSSRAASDALDRLVSDAGAASYRNRIKHVKSQQQRLHRDKEYPVASISAVKAILSGDVPESIDDLKAVVIDTLERVQTYIRESDTQAWRLFWEGDVPKDENYCRDRLIDNMRDKLPFAALVPEIPMPERKRADIAVIRNGHGIPIEIKGQWNRNVWNASSVQLIEQYTRDWRANGRGIYVVLWFGRVARRNLPKPPTGEPLPSSPNELCRMLREQLGSEERALVDVVVIDVSKP